MNTNLDRIYHLVLAKASELAPGMPLAGVTALAKEFGVSERTISRAVARLRKENRLLSIAGKGIFACDPYGNQQRMKHAADSVAEMIRVMISAGELKIGDPMPSIKYLTLQFKVSDRTVIDAYRILSRKGFICKVGKSFWVGEFHELVRNQGLKRTVVMFTEPGRDLDYVFQHDSLASAYRRMEAELRHCGFMLKVLPVTEMNSSLEQWRSDKEVPDGVMLLLGGNIGPFSRIEAFATYVQKYKPKPVRIVVDWNGGRLHTTIPRVHILSRGNFRTSSTRALARYFLHHGVKSAVLILNPRETNDIDFFWRYKKFLLEFRESHSNFNFIECVFCDNNTPSRDEVIARLQGSAAEGSKYYLEYLTEKYGGYDLGNLNAIQTVTSFDDMHRQFAQVRVWLFADNGQAIQALAGFGTATRHAIIGLGDNSAIAHHALTICGVDHDRMGYLMAHALIGDIPQQRTTRGLMKIDAEVMERESILPLYDVHKTFQ